MRFFKALRATMFSGLTLVAGIQAADFPYVYAGSNTFRNVPVPSGWTSADIRERFMAANGWVGATVVRDGNNSLPGTIMRRNPLSGLWEDIGIPPDVGYNFRPDQFDIRINIYGVVAITRQQTTGANPKEIVAFYDGTWTVPSLTEITQAWQVEQNGTRFLAGREISAKLHPGFWLNNTFNDFYAKLGNQEGNVNAILGTQMVTVSAANVNTGPFSPKYTADYTAVTPTFVLALPATYNFTVTQGGSTLTINNTTQADTWDGALIAPGTDLVHSFAPVGFNRRVAMYQTAANRGSLTMTQILPFAGDTSVEVNGISASGVVVGSSWNHTVVNDPYEVFLWTKASGTTVAVSSQMYIPGGNAWWTNYSSGITDDGALLAGTLIVPVPTVTLTGTGVGIDTVAARATDAITLRVSRSGGSTLLPLDVMIGSAPTIFPNTAITIPAGETTAIGVISLTGNMPGGGTNVFIVQASPTADATAAYSRANPAQLVPITLPSGNSDAKDWEYGIAQIGNTVDLPDPSGWPNRRTRDSEMSSTGWWVAVMAKDNYWNGTPPAPVGYDATQFTLIRWNPTTRVWTNIGRPALLAGANLDNDYINITVEGDGTAWVALENTDRISKYSAGAWTTPFGTTTIAVVNGSENGGTRLAGALEKTGSSPATYEPVVFNYPSAGQNRRLIEMNDLTGKYAAVAASVLGTRVIGGYAATLTDLNNKGPFPLFYVDLSNPAGTRFDITAASMGVITVPPYGPIALDDIYSENGVVSAGFYFTSQEKRGNVTRLEAAFYHAGGSGGTNTRIQPVLAGYSRVQIRGTTTTGFAVGTCQIEQENNGNLSRPFRWDPTSGQSVDLKTEVAPSHPNAQWFNGVDGITENGIIGAWGTMFLIPVPNVTLSVTAGTATEGGSAASITVTRTGVTMFPLTVSLSASGATGDLTVPATALIPAGQSSVVVSLAAVNDSFVEPDEFATVTIAKSSNGGDALLTYNILTTNNSGSITVVSNDFGVVTTLSTTGPNPTNTTIPVIVTFASAVTNFADGDVTVVNGTPGTISGSGATYSLTVIAAGDGVVQVNVAGGVADSAGTPNAAATTLNVTFDTTPAPVPSIPDLASASDLGTSNTDNITNVTTPTITGTVGGDAVAVRIYEGATLIGTDPTIVAGAWSIVSAALAGDGNHVLTAKSVDPVGNVSAASAGLTILLDTTRPAVTTSINPPVGAIANAFTGTITWSEDVSATFAVGDVTLDANTTVGGAMTGGPLAYSLPLTATAPGTLGFSIGVAASVADMAGNTQNTGASDVTATYTPAPFPVISLNGSTDPTRFSPILLKVTFSETVSGFDPATEINVTGGNLGNFVETTTNLVWTFELTPTGQGTDTLNINAAVATATVGGLSNIAANTFTVLYDSVAPSAPGTPDLISADDSGNNADNITSVRRPTFTGAAEAGATVALSSNLDGLIGQAVATGVAWTFTATADLSEGVHTLTAVATDPAGNVSPASVIGLSLTIDATAPAVTFTAPTTPTNNNMVAATGTVTNTAGNVVSIFESPATSLGVATVLTGNWTFTTAPLGDGPHTLFARATDVAGNSADSANRTVTVDTTPPAVPTALDLAAGSDTGSSVTDDLTNDTTPTISGSAPASTLVHLFSDGTPVGSIVSTAGGTWSITASVLASGSRVLTAKSEDGVGNQSAASVSLTIIIDTTPPAVVPSALDLAAVSDSGIATDNLTNIMIPTINGVGTTGDTIRLYDGGTLRGSATAAGGTWLITATTLADGLRTLTARAEDAAGNQTADSAPLSITIDTAAPVAPSALDLVAGSDSGTTTDNITNDTMPTINGAAESAATVQLFSGATLVGSGTAAAGAWSITTSTTLNEGVNNLTAVATDVAGNVSSASTPVFAVTIDTVAPTLTLGAPTLPGVQAAVRAGQTVTVVATYADVGGSGIGSITLVDANITLGGNATGASAIVGGGGLVSRTITATAGTDGGTFTVRVGIADTARDVAGNVAPTSAVSAAITLDNVLPTVVISTTAPATTADATIPVRLVFSEIVTGLIGTDLTLVNAMIATAPTSTDGGITWNGTITATATGAVQVGLAATTVADVVGNGNAVVAAATLTTYDTTGPTATVNQAASQADPTSGNITFTVVFSALVDPTTFNATTDMIFGGTAGGARTATGTVDGTGLIYTVQVSGMAAPAGTVTATLPANVVLSLVGAKPNQASTSTDNSVSWTVPVSSTPSDEEFAGGSTGKSGGPCGSGSGIAGLGLIAMLMLSLRGGRRQQR